jgi:ABC-type antimicrobial peptide transport system permease subunit
LIATNNPSPIGWYLIHSWLGNFVYRTEIGVFSFILAGALAVVIALVTISFQSFRAANANPVDSLRNE